MKKHFLSYLLLVIILASSCTQEEVVQQMASLSESKFVATFEQNDSRTYLENGKYLRWTANDELSIFMGKTLNKKFRFDGETGDNSGGFEDVSTPGFVTGNDLDNPCHYAVYPYNKGTKITETGVLTINLPSEQTYAEKSFGLGNNTMVAVTSSLNDMNLAFKNACGYLKFKLYGDDVTVRSVSVQSNGGEKLSGSATVTAAYGKYPSVVMSSTASDMVTLDCGETGVKLGSTKDEATEFWIVLPETSFSQGFTLTVTDVDGNVFEKTTSKTIVVERNVIKPISAMEVNIESVVESISMVANVTTPGALSTLISSADKYTITSLKVTGNLNGDDIVFIRDLAGVASTASVYDDFRMPTTAGRLTELDMSEATIVEGGSSYYHLYNPEGGTLPDDGAADFYSTRGMVEGGTGVQYYTDNNVIGTNMFKGCKLEKVKLPNSTVAIEDEAFAETNLNKVYCCIANPPTLSSSAFPSTAFSLGTLFVPVGYKRVYTSASNWNKFVNMEEEGEVEVDTTPYLTFKADGEQTLTMSNAVETLEYSVGGGTWNTLGTATVTFGGLNGDLRLRGKNLNGTHKDDVSSSIHFGNQTPVACIGDIRTLLDYENYQTADTQNARFCWLFVGCSCLISAPELPSMTLADGCYYGMFNLCSNLTEAPVLPATVLSEACYREMFCNTSLTQAPKLPATALENDCYLAMFSGCTSLKTAPELPAMTLSWFCYSSMFSGCTSLEAAPQLPATVLAPSCYSDMFSGCTSLEIAPQLPAKNFKIYEYLNAEECYARMFKDCIKLKAAPQLPATNLASGCYREMFEGCSSLTIAPNLPAINLDPESTWTGYYDCYASMFKDCKSLVSAPELPATILASGCYSRMFEGCVNLTVAPILPATSLKMDSYAAMFYLCENIKGITMLATNISASFCLDNWTFGVAVSGTFTKAKGVTLPRGVNGIPEGWAVVDYE